MKSPCSHVAGRTDLDGLALGANATRQVRRSVLLLTRFLFYPALLHDLRGGKSPRRELHVANLWRFSRHGINPRVFARQV